MGKNSVSGRIFSEGVRTMTSIAGVMAVCSVGAISGACAPPPTTLTVQVDAPLEAGVEVKVTGPGGFSKTITETTTFEKVTPGQYNVALVVRRKHIVRPFVDAIVAGIVTGSPATLDISDSATVSVIYNEEPGSGRAWIPVAGEDKIMALTGDELANNKAPSYALPTPAGSGPEAVAFRRGDLWVSLRNAGSVVKYDAMTLVAQAAPKVTATVSGLSSPSGILFDKDGDLFVSEEGAGLVTHWTTLDTTPMKKGILETAGTPRALALSADGNLFVATANPAAVVVFPAVTLAGTRPIAHGAIKGASTGLVAPSGLAFDVDGNLWVTNGDTAPAVRFDAIASASVEGEIDLAPGVALSPTTTESFDGMVLDNEGRGWFTAFQPQQHLFAQGLEMRTAAPVLGQPVDLGIAKPRAIGLGMPAFNPPLLDLPISR